MPGERLYLSYVGRDIRKNTERQPSVLLRELLDYLDQQYRLADGKDGEKLSGRLTTVHPLQPFSPRNYEVDRRATTRTGARWLGPCNGRSPLGLGSHCTGARPASGRPRRPCGR